MGKELEEKDREGGCDSSSHHDKVEKEFSWDYGRWTATVEGDTTESFIWVWRAAGHLANGLIESESSSSVTLPSRSSSVPAILAPRGFPPKPSTPVPPKPLVLSFPRPQTVKLAVFCAVALGNTTIRKIFCPPCQSPAPIFTP